MIKLSFTVKNHKYSLDIEKGQDILLTLDNFLKSNTLKLTNLKGIQIRCFGQDSVSLRVAKIIVGAIKKY